MSEQPFSNGSEYFVWLDSNCNLCKLGYDQNNEKFRCKLEYALERGRGNDGFVRLDYLKIMGLQKGGDKKCTKFSSFDGNFIPGTAEFEKQRNLDEAKLAAWTKGT